jgi:ubiquinone/menaquinone biosynthesis C-methylase UbiE
VGYVLSRWLGCSMAIRRRQALWKSPSFFYGERTHGDASTDVMCAPKGGRMFINRLNQQQLPHWQVIDGRRQRTDSYLFTNDPKERARLNFQHDLLKQIADQRNFLSAVTTPQMILDLACGTGIWGYEVAQQFPEAQVFNLDIDAVTMRDFLSKHAPRDNFNFIQANARDPLDFEDGVFDFVHSRFPDPFLTADLWPRYIREMVRVCRPEGWVELVTSGFFHCRASSPATEALLQAEIDLLSRINIAPTGAPKLMKYLKQAGVDPQKVQHWKFSLGKTTHLQPLALQNLVHVLRQTKPRLIRMGIMDEATFERQLAQLRADAQQHGLDWWHHRVWFQPIHAWMENV